MSRVFQQTFWLVAYDLRCLWRERGLAWLLASAVALSLWALVQGAQFQQDTAAATQAAQIRQDEARQAAQDLARRYFAEPEAFASPQWWRSPFDIRGYAFREHVGFAIKPALPGAALAVAQADVLPAAVRVRAESLESARSAYDIEHPARLAVGRFDLMFFVVYLWPLVLLALCAPVLTQERETRRLAPLRLQGVPPARLLLAQTVARTLAATTVLAACISGAAWSSGAVPADASGAAALGRWAGVLLAYSLCWAGVSALIGAWARSRMTAAFAGFGAWVLGAILLPALLAAAANLAAPVPSRERYIEAMRDANDQLNAERVPMLARFYDEHPQWRPARTGVGQVSSSVARIPRMLAQERLLGAVERRFEAARAGREALFAQWMAFSPASLASEALAREAGNDGARHRLFLAEVQTHHTALREFFNEGIQQAALRDELQPCPQTCLAGYGFTAFDAVPRFTASPALGQALPALTWPLLAWAAVLFTAAVLCLRERPARSFSSPES